ncbi:MULTISPECIES: helix-turn-helix domain-containing protein [Actinomadura]|uniref:helix-turn-helix domain-containing protein n=1 Tax=Actinomadura TaxID=1988 RepID=UPI0003FAE597|nr:MULTISPECIES: helix-turn-helix transcriptional regulator [Actinomadura]RSN71687.1 XRE family transcriptional regulator [Actinomadura sp. WAC 06369]
MPYTATVRGRRLARELRKLRQEAKLSGDQVARELEWEQSKISRMENAKMRITSGEVMELLELYGITGDKRTELVQLAREARKKGWWHSYEDVLSTGFSDYLAFESEALTYRTFQSQLIPGILQTADYARAIFRGARPRTTEEIERAVEARLARQERLTTSTNPLHARLVIDESTLHRSVGDTTVMRAQLRRVLELGELANVSVQVLPFEAGVHAAIDGPFTLLTFKRYPEVLYMEHFMGWIYLEKPSETERSNVVFDHLTASALNTSKSARLIHQMASGSS